MYLLWGLRSIRPWIGCTYFRHLCLIGKVFHKQEGERNLRFVYRCSKVDPTTCLKVKTVMESQRVSQAITISHLGEVENLQRQGLDMIQV